MKHTRVGDRNEIRLASDSINLYVGATRNRQARVAAFQLSPAPAACQRRVTGLS